MRVLLPLALPLLLVACGSKPGDQPGVVTNILDEVVPNAQNMPPPDNAITPVEPPPALPRLDADAAADGDGAIPIALQGHWTGLRDRCGDKAADMALRVTAASLVFHESVGTVKRVARTADGRLSVAAEFTGEGESWTRTLALRPSADGRQLTITNDGESVVRKRCI